MLSVTLLSASEVLFEGAAEKVILPGEKGIFEIRLLHKPFISRLLPGTAWVDNKKFLIRHGVAKVKSNRVIAMVEIENGVSSHAA